MRTPVSSSLLALLIGFTALPAAAVPSGATPAAARPLIQNGVVWLGDSRLAREYNTTGSPTATAWKWDGAFMTVGHALAGQRLIDLGNFATSGDRSDQYLTAANIAAGLATNAKYAAFYGCYNDINQNYPTATTSGQTCAGNVEAACNSFTSQGRTCIILREPCALSCTNAEIAQMMAVNTRFAEYLRSNPNVVLYDPPGSIRDYTVGSMAAFKACYVAAICVSITANSHGTTTLDGIGSTGGIASGYLVSGPCIQGNTIVSSFTSTTVTLNQGAANTTTGCPVTFQSTEGGGIHEENLGGWIDGIAWAALETSLVPNPAPRNIEPFNNAGGVANQQLGNPLFLTPTGGVAGAGTTGSVPSGWATTASNATATVSTAARADGAGGNVQLVITPAAAGAYAKLYASPAASNFSPGDKLQTSCEVSVAPGSAMLAGVELYLQLSVDGGPGVEIADDGTTDYTKGTISQNGFTIVRQTDPQAIPPGKQVTSITDNIRIWFTGAAATTTTVSIGKCELHKVI